MVEATRSDCTVEIGNRIGRLRVQRGWSQERLGLEAGIKASQISKIELGEALPKITTIMAICEALNCSYDEVLPASSDMKISLNPQIIELDRAMESLTPKQRDQIISTALAAAKYYSSH